MTTTAEFKRAVDRLHEALQQPFDEFIRDSVIQRFEFSIEIAWKTAKKVMGTPTSAPKDIIREMAQNGYIQDVGVWLRAVDMRNLSSHTYKEDLAKTVFQFVQSFSGELKKLCEQFEKRR